VVYYKENEVLLAKVIIVRVNVDKRFHHFSKAR